MKEELKACPCGKIPKELSICIGSNYRWAYVGAGCCDAWEIEFKTQGYDIDSKECMEIAITEWNSATRAELKQREIGTHEFCKAIKCHQFRDNQCKVESTPSFCLWNVHDLKVWLKENNYKIIKRG